MQQLMQRLNDLIKANAHHAIDQMEEPERMLKQYLRELDQEMRGIRLQLARAVAGEKRLEQEVEALRSQIENLGEQAAAALEEGDEKLARAAVDRKLDREASAEALEAALQKATQAVGAARDKLTQIEALREQARQTRLSLLARHRAAKTLHSVHRAMPEPGVSAAALSASERISDLAERISDYEATAHGLEAIATVEPGGDTLERAQRKRSVERELRSLKARLKRPQ